MYIWIILYRNYIYLSYMYILYTPNIMNYTNNNIYSLYIQEHIYDINTSKIINIYMSTYLIHIIHKLYVSVT